MNYYQMRAMIANDTGEFLTKYPDENYRGFLKRMVLKYGASERLVKDIIGTYGLKVESDGSLVKLDE